MLKQRDRKIWVAVCVHRGFISDILAFREEGCARRQDRSWRRTMNPDYDDTAVTEVAVKRRRVAR